MGLKFDKDALVLEETLPEWAQYEDNAAAQQVTTKFVMNKWVDDQDCAQALFVILAESLIVCNVPELDDQAPEIMVATTYAVLAQYNKLRKATDEQGDPLPAYDRLQQAIHIIWEGKQQQQEDIAPSSIPSPKPTQTAPQQHEESDSSIMQIKVDKIEITSFIDRRGVIFDTQTGTAATLSIQVHLENIAIVDIPPSFMAGLVDKLFDSLNTTLQNPRYTKNIEAMPSDGRDGERSKQQAQSHNPPKNTPQPPSQQGNAKPAGRFNKQGDTPPKDKDAPPPPVMMKKQPDQATVPNWETIEKTRAKMIAMLKDNMELIEVFAIQRVFHDQSKKTGLVFIDINGEKLLTAWDNKDSSDEKTFFKDPFYIVDKGGLAQNEDGTFAPLKNSLLSALKRLKTDQMLYFNEPVYFCTKQSDKGHTYIGWRMSIPESWSTNPFYEE